MNSTEYEVCRKLSQGNVTDEELKKYTIQFIRGEDDLAVYEGLGSGRKLSAWEAYKIFPSTVFSEILEYGSAYISVEGEPGATLKKQRENLGFSVADLSSESNLSISEINEIENGLSECSFNDISILCRCLGINNYTIGYKANDFSQRLGVRLKEGKHDGKVTQKDISTLIRCGWMADTQVQLQDWLDTNNQLSTNKCNDYGSFVTPAYEVGYRLARKTRELLNISPSAPISSMRDLCKRIGIPYIQTELSNKIAGATVGTNYSRCIVINMDGRNSNPWRRRITVAHELAHLLWDSEENLRSLNINFYEDEDLENYQGPYSQKRIEQRANAFAVEFLLPSLYVEDKCSCETVQTYIRKVMEKYGVSFISAKQHLFLNGKLNQLDLEALNASALRVDTDATDEWKGSEDFTYDYFPIRAVPSEMRGRFAYWVCKALNNNIISLDSAATILKCSEEDINQYNGHIIELLK